MQTQAECAAENLVEDTSENSISRMANASNKINSSIPPITQRAFSQITYAIPKARRVHHCSWPRIERNNFF